MKFILHYVKGSSERNCCKYNLATYMLRHTSTEFINEYYKTYVNIEKELKYISL